MQLDVLLETGPGGMFTWKIFQIRSSKTPFHGHEGSKKALEFSFVHILEKNLEKVSKTHQITDVFFALFDICDSCNMKLGDSFQAYHVETVACAHTCVTQNSVTKICLAFKNGRSLLQQIIFTPLLN